MRNLEPMTLRYHLFSKWFSTFIVNTDRRVQTTSFVFLSFSLSLSLLLSSYNFLFSFPFSRPHLFWLFPTFVVLNACLVTISGKLLKVRALYCAARPLPVGHFYTLNAINSNGKSGTMHSGLRALSCKKTTQMFFVKKKKRKKPIHDAAWKRAQTLKISNSIRLLFATAEHEKRQTWKTFAIPGNEYVIKRVPVIHDAIAR